MIRRRSFLTYLSASASCMIVGSTWLVTPARAEDLRFEIGQLLIAIRQKLATGDRATAKRLAEQLPIFSQRDPNWSNYPESFQIARILVSLTNPSDRAAWIFANRGVVETMPGSTEGDGRENNRAIAASAYAILLADAGGPPLLTSEYRGRVASLLLVMSGVAPGHERVTWAKLGRQQTLAYGNEALNHWSVDNITPRMAAAGVAVSGDWSEAAREYYALLPRATGSMPDLFKKRPGQPLSGLAGTVGGQSTLDAEAATAFAMSGQYDAGIQTLEKSRQDSLAVRRRRNSRSGTNDPMRVELELVTTGTVIVQPVASYVGAFALVSVQRQGRLQRYTAFDPDFGGLELFYRLMGTIISPTERNGLLPYYLSVRRAASNTGANELAKYASRASEDSYKLIGKTLRTALKTAQVGPRDDVLVVVPANIAMLPIGIQPGAGLTPEAIYRLRFVDSLQTAARCRDQVLARTTSSPTISILTGGATAGLPYAGFEVDCVGSNFAPAQRVEMPGSRGRRLLEALDGVDYWHITSHGNWNFDHPRESGLALGDGGLTTIGDILDLELNKPPRLVFLSACETALFDLEVTLSQFTGLCTAFLASGAACVIGSLWPVSDAATSLLAAKFYEEHIGAKAPPAEALQRAQIWLRGSTSKEMHAYVLRTVTAGKVTVESAAGLSDFLATLSPTQRPFEHPYYWGGFQVYGA